MPTIYAEYNGSPHQLAANGAWLLDVKFGFDPNWKFSSHSLPSQLQFEVDAMIDTGATGFVVPDDLFNRMVTELAHQGAKPRELPWQPVNDPQAHSTPYTPLSQRPPEPVYVFHLRVDGLNWASEGPGILRPVRSFSGTDPSASPPASIARSSRPAIIVGRECLHHLRMSWDAANGEVKFTT